jgi:uncharacterized protein (TIGR02145 family)
MTVKEQMAYDTNGDDTDSEVFGDLYQWGRTGDGHEKRNSGTTTTQYADPAAAAAGGKFVIGNNNLDWISNKIDDLWGNGGDLAAQTNTTYTGSQNVNNPCPPGYRVPTQHEWALLGNDAGGSGVDWGDYFSTDSDGNSDVDGYAATPTGNPGITWVRVSEGRAAAYNTWTDDGETRGYALYDSTVWTNAAPGYKNGNDLLSDAAAPEPLLFLPAGGYRDYHGGYVYDAGSNGRYWGSVVDGPHSSSYVYFYSSNVDAGYYDSHAMGMSVRCIAE